MSVLLIGDLHLTDRPRDAYRFDIFPWIAEQQAKHKPAFTFIMGDLCDQKDRHSATLVNRVVDSLTALPDTFIIMGNHDYIDRDNPFFNFLNKLEGVLFITKQMVFDEIAVIPHYRTQEEFNAACREIDDVEILLLHNTFDGAISETGKKLTGLRLHPALSHATRIYAGDVHKPQKSNEITYVGAPYHIRFGDDYKPRCLLVSPGKADQELYFEAPRKWKLTVHDVNDLISNRKLCKGDQVKITIELDKEEAVDWKKHRNQVQVVCDEKELEVFGIDLKINTTQKRASALRLTKTPNEIFAAFCRAEGLGDQTKDAGKSILEDNA